ncbi:MAG: helix-turn-helix transcriptional regulator [Bacillota bacterium]|nr:helix-turn-helix transcriptional regulator [Bacillota bacterium]
MNSEIQRYKELADFLKTRRAKILPSQVGLPSVMRRRTSGLRREEVAQLAGIGVTWYTWLEQGRSIHVSAQVIESLARVLLLDKQERIHLYLLANQPLPADIPGYQGTVSPVLQHVLDSLTLSPSLVTDQRWNVIAWNQAACAILGDFSKMNIRERNIVWAMFTDNKFKQLYVDWKLHAKGLLGRFRSTCGQYIEDSWLAQFIDDLKMQSAEFNLWWPLHEIQGNSEVYKQLYHPVAGILDFEVSNFDVSDNSGLKMIVHTPLPGTDTTVKMKSLLD